MDIYVFTEIGGLSRVIRKGSNLYAIVHGNNFNITKLMAVKT